MQPRQEFKLGDMIKINPTVFGTDLALDSMHGDLGYVRALESITWQIVEMVADSPRGKAVKAKAIDFGGLKVVKSEGSMVILLKDIVLAINKYKVGFEFLNCEYKYPLIEELKLLKDYRLLQKESGTAVTRPEMKENMQAIRDLKAKIDEEYPSKILVKVPKCNRTFYINRSSISDTDPKIVERLLMNLIRDSRHASREIPIEVKRAFGVSYTLTNKIHMESGTFVKMLESIGNNYIHQAKKPTTNDTYVGIEIELLYLKGDEFKKLLIRNKLHKNVDIASDSSVHVCHNNPNHSSAELRVLSKIGDLDSVLNRLNKVFNHRTVDAYANRSCGLHVHLDMRNRHVENVYRNLVRVQELILSTQPTGRVKNKFCIPNVNDDWTNGDDNAKYKVINKMTYGDKSTIEVRIHEGSTDCESIANWVAFLNAIADFQGVIPKADYKTAEQLSSVVSLPANAIKYVDSRVAKFGNVDMAV